MLMYFLDFHEGIWLSILTAAVADCSILVLCSYFHLKAWRLVVGRVIMNLTFLRNGEEATTHSPVSFRIY
jgi:hypothetical protein